MANQQKHGQLRPTNHDVEVALLHIARGLLKFTQSQNDPVGLGRLNRLFDAFQEIAYDYCTQTGTAKRFDDMAFDLSTVGEFKHTFLTVPPEVQAENERKKGGSSGITADLVDEKAELVLAEIEYLEKQLGYSADRKTQAKS